MDFAQISAVGYKNTNPTLKMNGFCMGFVWVLLDFVWFNRGLYGFCMGSIWFLRGFLWFCNVLLGFVMF